jgi:transglutaminase-like putative cysteine protease
LAELLVPLLAALALVGGGALAPDLIRDLRASGGLQRTLGSWLGVVLAVVLALACAGALSQTALPHLGGASLLAATAGTLLAVGAGRWLRWRALALAALAGVTLAVAMVSGAAVAHAFGGSPQPWTVVQAQLHQLSPAGFEPLALLMVSWGTGVWVGWLALRERSGVMACTVPLVVLTADLVNVPKDLVGLTFWPVLGALVCGLALMGWTHQERQARRWQRLARTSALPRSGLGLALISALALSAVSLLVPPLNRHNFSSRFFHSGPVVPAGSHSQLIAPISGYATEVVPGGPIRQERTPVLSYSTSAPGGSTYLSGIALTQFVNGNWYPGPQQSLVVGEGTQLPYSERPANDTSATQLDRKVVSLQVTYLGTGAQEVQDLLYPGSPIETPYLSGRYRLSGLAASGQLLTVDSVAAVGGSSQILPSSQEVTTVGTVSTATPSQLESAGQNYPSWVQPDATLPELADFLDESQLAADALAMSGGATNPYLAAINIQNALRQAEIYTLDPPTPPSGVWPILYFLDQSHRGYCQYFASAMGAMLRALGIPTRLVNGFGPGQEGQLKNGQWLITQADAHTWVQVYFPHYGWVNFEPTPDGFYQPTGAAARVTPLPAPPPSIRAPHPGVRNVPAATGRGARAVRRRPQAAPTIAAGTGGAALLLLLVLVWAWWRRVTSPQAMRRRLELPLRLAGEPRPEGRTLLELADLCANLRPDPPLRVGLSRVAAAGDELAFGRSRERARSEMVAGWSELRGAYPRLLWAALRARGRGPRPAPGRKVAVARARARG